MTPTRLLAALAFAGASVIAHAAPVVRTGTLVFDTDVVQIGFTLAHAASVSIWTIPGSPA